MPYKGLRDKIRSPFDRLHKRLFDKAKLRMLFGKTPNGAMYTNLVKSYDDAQNSG